MNIKSFASFSLLAGLLLPTATRAQSFVDLLYFSFGQGTSNALPSAGAPANFSVATFNESLGTLNSVTLSLQATGTVYAEALNFTSSNQVYTGAMETLNFGVTGPDGSSTNINPSTDIFAGTIAPTGTVAVPTGSTPFSLSPAAINVLSSNFGLFETPGSGLFTLSFNSDGEAFPISSVISAPSGVFGSGNATVSGVETVTYNYTPIPEPSVSAMIFGCATLTGVVGLRRRSAKKSSLSFALQSNSSVA